MRAVFPDHIGDPLNRFNRFGRVQLRSSDVFVEQLAAERFDDPVLPAGAATGAGHIADAIDVSIAIAIGILRQGDRQFREFFKGCVLVRQIQASRFKDIDIDVNTSRRKVVGNGVLTALIIEGFAHGFDEQVRPTGDRAGFQVTVEVQKPAVGGEGIVTGDVHPGHIDFSATRQLRRQRRPIIGPGYARIEHLFNVGIVLAEEFVKSEQELINLAGTFPAGDRDSRGRVGIDRAAGPVLSCLGLMPPCRS